MTTNLLNLEPLSCSKRLGCPTSTMLPSSITRTRSQPRTVSTLWAMVRTVLSARQCWITSCTIRLCWLCHYVVVKLISTCRCRSVSSSTLAVASSMRTILQGERTARTRQSSCFWPVERLPPCSLILPLYPETQGHARELIFTKKSSETHLLVWRSNCQVCTVLSRQRFALNCRIQQDQDFLLQFR